MNEDCDELVFAKNKSPLLIGKGENNSYFVASDISAFASFTTNVIILPDNHYGFISSDLLVYSLDDNIPVKLSYQNIPFIVEAENSNDCKHHLYKEILEQPLTILQAIGQEPDIFVIIAKLIKNADRVYVTGCGTSFHAALTASQFFARIAGISVTPVLSSEFDLYSQFIDKNSVLIALSQSGETADVIDAVRSAKNKAAKIIALVNMSGTTLPRLADYTIYLRAGIERSVLSTKTFTAQLALLYLLANSVVNNFSQAHSFLNAFSKDLQYFISNQESVIKTIAEKTYNASDYFIIGREIAYSCAMEGALKIKEVSYIHAEGFAGGELKHGTLALIQNEVPVIALVTPDTRTRILSNVMEIKSRGGKIIGIDSENNSAYDFFIQLPLNCKELSLILCIPLQLLAYHLAVLRGCDPDKPRNLAKSVTVH